MSQQPWPDEQKISLYVAGALEGDEAEAITELILQDDAFAARVAEENQILADLAAGSPRDPGQQFWGGLSDQIMDQIDADTVQQLEIPAVPKGGGLSLVPNPFFSKPVMAFGGMLLAAAMMLLVVNSSFDGTDSGTPVVASMESPVPGALSNPPVLSDLAAFEGITLESLLGGDLEDGLLLEPTTTVFSIAQLPLNDGKLKGLDFGVEPIEILGEGEPETYQDLSGSELETLMAALDRAMVG